MLADMKEQMKEQQLQSDRDREQVALNHENTTSEQEALKYLNNQLQLKSLPSKTPQPGAFKKRSWNRRISQHLDPL